MNCPHWLLACHYSVFKERPGTHLSSRCWCRVARRTVPDKQLLPEGLLRFAGGPLGRSDGCVTLSDPYRSVNASELAGQSRGIPGPGLAPNILPGGRRRPADAGRHPGVACGSSSSPHATRCSKVNQLSALPSPSGPSASVRCRLSSSIYRQPSPPPVPAPAA